MKNNFKNELENVNIVWCFLFFQFLMVTVVNETTVFIIIHYVKAEDVISIVRHISLSSPLSYKPIRVYKPQTTKQFRCRCLTSVDVHLASSSNSVVMKYE